MTTISCSNHQSNSKMNIMNIVHILYIACQLDCYDFKFEISLIHHANIPYKVFSVCLRIP